jgi:hypothetical protein
MFPDMLGAFSSNQPCAAAQAKEQMRGRALQRAEGEHRSGQGQQMSRWHGTVRYRAKALKIDALPSTGARLPPPAIVSHKNHRTGLDGSESVLLRSRSSSATIRFPAL